MIDETTSFDDLMDELEAIETHQQKHSTDVDPVQLWLDACTYFDPRWCPKLDLFTTDIRANYNFWALKNDYPEMNAHKFSAIMLTKEWPRKGHQKNGRWGHTYAGLRLKTDPILTVPQKKRPTYNR